MSSAGNSSSVPKAASSAQVAPTEEMVPLVGARDLEADGERERTDCKAVGETKMAPVAEEPKQEYGKNLIWGSLVKGCSLAGDLAITSSGLAVQLWAFWCYMRGTLSASGVWLTIPRAWLATCIAMTAFQGVTCRCRCSCSQAWKFFKYYLSLGLVFLFGSIAAFVGLFWYHYDFGLVGGARTSFGLAWGLLRSDPVGCFKRLGMALATVLIAPITALSVGLLEFSIDDLGEEQDEKDKGLQAKMMSSPSFWSAIFLSLGLPLVILTWKITIIEGLLLFVVMAPCTYGTSLLPVLVLVLFKLAPVAGTVLCGALLLVVVVIWADHELAVPSVLSVVLLLGGAYALLGDILSPLQALGLAVPDVLATLSNITTGVAWVDMPALNPAHPSQLEPAEKAQRLAFWPVFLTIEACVALASILGLLVLGSKAAGRLLSNQRCRLDQQLLTLVSITAMRSLLVLCLKVQVLEALTGTRFEAGLLWEGYFLLLTPGLLWQFTQALLLALAQPGANWGVMPILSAFVGGVGPFLSDAFDQVKDAQLAIIALSSGSPVGEAIGLVSSVYLILYNEHQAWSPELSSELPTGYLTLWVMNPKAKNPEGASGPCCSSSCLELLKGAVSQAPFLAYKQARPYRLECLLVEDSVQAGLSLLFLASTGKAPMVVVVLNLGLPLLRLLFILFLHRPLLFRAAEKIGEETFIAAAAGRFTVAGQWARELLSGPKVSTEKLQAWADMHWPALAEERTFRLGDMGLGDPGAFLGAVVLMASPQLEKLDLGANSIGDEGAKALAEALPGSQLQQLNLHGNSIGDEGAKALAEALPGSKLQELYLGDNSIGDEGAKALAEALPGSQLQRLDLDGNSIGDEGAKALAEALPGSQLKGLWLGGNSIGDEGRRALEEKKPQGLELDL